MIDCHLHLQDPRLWSSADDIVRRLRELGVERLVVNGTGPDDWDGVRELAERYPEVIPFFGLHPWKVNDAPAWWRERLEEFVEATPGAGVGEIGLDKWMRDHDVPGQKEALAWQLELAHRLGRPVAVHCLQAWGHLEACLRESSFAGGLLLHSFAGPAEMVDDFVGLGAHFSLSGYFFRPEKAGKLAVFERIPDERLLLETDAPDMAPPSELVVESLEPVPEDEGTPVNHPANIAGVYRAFAEWRGLARDEAEALVDGNARRWLGETA